MGRLPKIAIALAAATISSQTVARGTEFDVVIKGGQIIDGTGASPYHADLAIKDGQIVRIGNFGNAQAVTTIDARGLMVAPGFIDLHTHVDRDILNHPAIENYIRQGVTTVVGGNCGESPVPIGDFVASVQDSGISLNLALLVGHNALRRTVMGLENRAPTALELNHMKSLLEDAMRGGTFGLSTGLKYVPGAYANTDEVVALARVAGNLGGFYATHLREEGPGLIEALTEALAIGRAANLPVHISHHKLVGQSMWNKSRITLAMIDKARSQGLDVTLDQYPYTASSTMLAVLFPAWALAGGQDEIRRRLDNPGTRATIKAAIIANLREDRGGGDPSRVVMATYPADPTLAGKNISEITVLLDREVTMENAAETVMGLQYKGGGFAVYHAMHEDDVGRIMRHLLVSIASDGSAVGFNEDMPHPRNYGTFPRVLGHYVHDRHVLRLEEAIQKMTTLPASRLGLKNRGRIAEGMIADLALFNPNSVHDNADWAAPHQYPDGIPYVIVNGHITIDAGRYTGILAGKVLRGPAYSGGLAITFSPSQNIGSKIQNTDP